MVIWVTMHILHFKEVYGGWDEMVKGPLDIKG